jgi:hypothetical protein
MRWYFRDISDDPSEKELTQLDQFNNDEVALAEALVRETIQNSTDAQTSSNIPVRVRFAISDTPPDADLFRKIVSELAEHLKQSKFDLPAPTDPLRLLVVEDFETTGLTGSVDTKDNGQFSGFWRRFGRSNKKGSKGGRWGLGKLVFPSASSVRVVLGLTRRGGEKMPWLMGQAILRNHAIKNREHDSVGFWCSESDDRKGAPTGDPKICEPVARAAGLVRKSEPGLSLMIPYLLPDITKNLLIEATVRNYYFPILTGRLCVIVNDDVIDDTTFDHVANSLPGAVPHAVLDFVRQLQRRQQDTPNLILPPTWQDGNVTAELLGPEVVSNLRDRFKNGELLIIRAPLTVVPKSEHSFQTHIDLFLRAARPGEKSQTLVVRGAITVPTEGKRTALPECHAALVANDDQISRLLGDAENPAHTQWNERAEKLRAEWQGGNFVLRRVRAVLPEIYQLLTDRIERVDPLALLEFFSIPKSSRPGAAPQAPTGGRPANLPLSMAKAFRIEKRAGGFAILPDQGIETVQFPMKMRVRCAYDVLTGNPFKRFSEYDFSFYGASLTIQKKNANCWPTEPNAIDAQAERPDFKIEVVGFDPNRDLIIEAQS